MTATNCTGQSAMPTRAQLQSMRRGVEKESLRALPNGNLALTPHPVDLGSALMHPHITTDFSESQLELITDVHDSTQACMQALWNISQTVVNALPGEMIWAHSMPCLLPVDEAIPIGRYGTSNIGRAKSVYRAGLGHRYGKRMQTISGIHYNWSMQGVGTEGYLALIRNFRRHGWLLLYLFGASPAVDGSFVKDRMHDLEVLGCGSFHLPFATSLRMGRLGYQSAAQDRIAVSFNCLESYAASLTNALTDVYPDYQRIGVRSPSGEYNQLAESLLQIENEFYGIIRPKCMSRQGERPLYALRALGVEYIEVRLLDLNPFHPLGIDACTMRFLDAFLLYCLYTESPPDSSAEIAAMNKNQHRVANQGRNPALMLERDGQAVALRTWVNELLQGCYYWAEQIDAALQCEDYRKACTQMQALHAVPENLPSAQVLQAIAATPQQSFLQAARSQSLHNDAQLRQSPVDETLALHFSALAQASVQAQAETEAADTVDFEVFRQHYTTPTRLHV